MVISVAYKADERIPLEEDKYMTRMRIASITRHATQHFYSHLLRKQHEMTLNPLHTHELLRYVVEIV